MWCMKQQSRWVSQNKNKLNVAIPSICTSYKACQYVLTLTYKISDTRSIPPTYISIKGTCTSKHLILCDVWSNKVVDECHRITTNQMYQSVQCAHHTNHTNDLHHWLTKPVALEVSHLLISPLKEVAWRNIPFYVIYEATK
jgi:hypothetical protein